MKIIRKAFGSPPSWGLVLGLGVVGSWSILAPMPTAAAPAQAAGSRGNAEKPGSEHQATPAAAGTSSTTAPAGGKPATARVEKGPFRVVVTLSGVFEAKKAAEVSIRPRNWTMPLVVDRVIELGTPVKKGDVLV